MLVRKDMVEWSLSMETTITCSFETFCKQLPFKEIIVKNLERKKQYI